MPEIANPWSLINTIINVLLLSMAWGIRRGILKIDKIVEGQQAMSQELATLKTETTNHEEKDRMRYDEHNRRLDEQGSRLDRLAVAR